ncbi:helix-turn-helix domain-containing protein [Streptomyces sp. NPDC014623]|uniref:helix-turn-helix domain-containing protein n=1 Tax=Streptomyces sp. NPDC014623 TaxID=3364875 RepID=UPI003702A93A
MSTCIIAVKSVMMWSVAGMIPVCKIRFSVEKSSTDNVRIMTTGRIELGPTGRTVAANVKRLREARGLTLRGLSAELKERGRPLSADALNKIENGAQADGRAVRRVDVDDLAALSAAFGVGPLALLLPVDTEASTAVHVTGTQPVSAHSAWMWGTGEGPIEMPQERGTAASGRALYAAVSHYRLHGLPHWLAELQDAQHDQGARMAATEAVREAGGYIGPERYRPKRPGGSDG